VRPAVNVGLSVSRVGGAAQTKAMKQVAGTLRLDLAQFRELAAFAQFGSDLDKSTLAQIERGKRMVELLKQDQYVPMSMVEQVAVLFAATQGYIDDIPVEAVKKFEQEFLMHMKNLKADVLKELGDKKAIDDDLKAKLIQAIEDFKKGFRA
jgi:F-type H+-transporting ATPase subunit alpha